MPTGPYKPGERVELPPGGAVLLDKLGAVAIRTEPSDELAVLLELGGRLNKSPQRDLTGYVLGAGTAAELIANIVVAVQRLRGEGSPEALEFGDELDRAIKREQERLVAVDEEHHA